MERNDFDPSSVLIIGAGPNGLAAAAFLYSAGAKVIIHGDPLETWRDKMPDRMILRSTIRSTSIASPGDAFSISQYEKQTGITVDYQPTLAQFIAYGQWFQEQAVPEVNRVKVKKVKREGKGFTATLENGSMFRTKSVVLATGITPYPYVPDTFSSVSIQLASHISGCRSFREFQNKKVVVIGKGQSALESAALLHESGARVEIITRGDRLNFINLRIRKGLIGRMIAMPEIHQFLYPPTDLAGPPYNWAIADPALYRRLSKTEQAKLFQLVGPIGSKDLKSRLADVLVTTQVEVKKAYEQGQKICLNLSDGTQREVDHVFLATGYRPNINQCEILGKDLKAAIAQEEGYPLLTIKYESTTVKNLYVLGALACKSQGPINRFICGTYLVGQYLTEAITGSRIGYPNRKISRYIVGRSLFYRMHQIYSGSVLNKMRAGSQ